MVILSPRFNVGLCLVVGSNLGEDSFLRFNSVFSYRLRGVSFVYQFYLVLMVVCIHFFSLSSSEGRIGPVLGPLRGPRPGQICPWPTLHARSLDARDAQRSSAASRGGRLNGGVLELSSRCVKGILVFGGGYEEGGGGGEN